MWSLELSSRALSTIRSWVDRVLPSVKQETRDGGSIVGDPDLISATSYSVSSSSAG